MDQAEFKVFSLLYREAYSRCFGLTLAQPVSETEGKLFSQQILDQSGLTIGWRSLKNYSLFVLSAKTKENPSIASMDTLARYVLKAPYTNEIDRKDNESHHPYWYMYREKHLAVAIAPPITKKVNFLVMGGVGLLLIIMVAYIWYQRSSKIAFTDQFTELSEKGLQQRNWAVLNKDSLYWAKRTENPNNLTLFTLPGDNWPDDTNKAEIKNLLIRRLPEGCFTTELQMEDFIPAGEWQQAGLLLLEDTTLNGPGIRISLAYNNFFGGFKKPDEILVQAISVPGNGGKPEEFVHNTVLTIDSVTDKRILQSNLKQTALRVEKKGNHYRLLYSGGADPNGAFKELVSKKFDLKPRYIAIFALKGRVEKTPVVPVKIKQFMLKSIACE